MIADILAGIIVLFIILGALTIIATGVGKIVNVTVEQRLNGFLCAWMITLWLSVSVPVCAVIVIKLLSKMAVL